MQLPMVIDGKEVHAAFTFTVNNPATGMPAGEAPNGEVEHLDAAVAAAKAAFPAWSALSDEERKGYCDAVVAKIGEVGDEIAPILTQEQGKPLNGIGSRFEMQGAAGWAAYTSSLSLPMKVLQDDNEMKVEMHRKPIGVVGSITPWNWPVLIAIWHIIPALRTGNTVVLKPSPYTPLSTLRLVRHLNDVLPAGVLNVISCDDITSNLGAAMSEHPDIGKIIFTGSIDTGKKVMMSGAETMKRLTLELSGNDAGIVLPDVDPAEIAEGLFWGCFINLGQTCAALKRLYVHEDVYDAVCEALVAFARNIPMGDGMDEESILGPVNNKAQFDKVARLVEESKDHGRVLLGGAPGEGLFYPITIIADLNNGDPLVDEEQFGPAIPIIKYSDIDDAVAAANDSQTGLGGSVWSKDIEAAKAIAARLECGTVWINSHGGVHPHVPFGGVKKSGIGVEFGEEGLKEYTDIQVVIS